MNKKILIWILIIVLIIAGAFRILINKNIISLKSIKGNSDGSIHILSSIDDRAVVDSMWCGTFQLVWNDMINNVVKQDVVFNPQLEIVDNLNKQTITTNELSPDSYFTKFGLLTLDLKEAIEQGIKEKFNETSSILDGLDRSNVPQSNDYYNGVDEKKYGFYAMLKKKFKFRNTFDQLKDGDFDNKFHDIKYFGIDNSSKDSLGNQVYVYYYNSDQDFAVSLESSEGEDVILARGVNGDSFIDMYNNILKEEKKYKGKHSFTDRDYLKVPELNISSMAEFAELENKEFVVYEGIGKIEQAIQTIDVKLDKEGGEVKSEAWMSLTLKGSATINKPEKIRPRYFYFDEPYTIFIKESDKELPYFAAQITDITLFQ